MRGYSNPEDRKDLKNLKSEQRIKSTTCALTSKPLVEPIVACELGYLYNKEDALTALIDKTLNPAFSHIRGLKDLRTLKLTVNPAFQAITSAMTESNEAEVARYICPVTGDVFNGSVPFSFIWTTSYVLSDRALRELGIDKLQAEYGPFTSNDVIRINPSAEEREVLQSKLSLRRVGKKSSESKRKLHAVSSEEEPKQSHQAKKSAIAAGAVTTDSHTVAKAGAPSATRLSSAHSLTQSATQEVVKQNEQSAVFRGLFHTDQQAKKSDRDLFMSVAGMRYTLS